MTIRDGLWSAGFVAAGLGFIATGAHAQSAPAAPVAPASTASSDAGDGQAAGSTEILVTARKRAEKLQDVPMSISAVSGKTLETERLFRVQDFSAKIANFAAIQQNTRVSGLYLRGLGGNASSDGAESGVGLIVDNVFMTYPGFSWLDFIDLDHVEVARGPQGTLLGKNTTIGALIVTTKLPSFKPELDMDATVGNRGFYSLHADATGPVIGDKLAFRLTLYDDEGSGWVNNTYNNTKLLNTSRWAARGQLLYVDGNVTDRLIAEHHESNEYDNAYIPVGDVTSYVSGAARAGWQSKLGKLFGYTPKYGTVDADTEGLVRSQTNGISNQLDWKLGDNTLTSVTAWRALKYRPTHDADLSPFPILNAGYDVDASQVSQELRFASPIGRRIEYQVGLYFLREDVTSNNRSQFLADSTTYFLSPLLPAAVTNGVEYDQRGHEQVTSEAAFGQATWHVTDKASLTGGVRYTRETKDASNVATSFGGAALAGALAPYRAALITGFGGTFTLDGSKTFNSVSWLINPAYKFSDAVLGYASVSYAAKSGAANLSATPGKPVIILPEGSTDYEVGVKTTLAGGRVTLNGDLYWDDITNYQAAQIDPTRLALGSYLGNAGHVRLRGVELEGTARIASSLSVSLSGAYNDAKYVSYVGAPAPIEYGTGTLSLSGQPVVGSAKWNGQASVNYDQPIAPRVNLFAYANESYRSSSNLVNPLSAYGWQPAYGLTNAGIGLKRPDNSLSIEAWSRNLFDKGYAVGIQAASAVAPVFVIPGNPRTFGLTVRGRF